MPNMTSQQLRDYEARMRGTNRNPPVPADASEQESDLQDAILAECRRRMWFVVYSGMHKKTSTTLGTPDFIIYADNNRVITVETKSRYGKQTPEQLGVQLMLEKLGHKYYLVRSFQEFLTVITVG